jgi:glycosyltransferase involved in cell wall biosynthesis
MTTGDLFLTITIHAPLSRWNTILTKGLRPIMHTLDQAAAHYKLRFDLAEGAAIKFSVITTTENRKTISTLIDQYATGIFEANRDSLLATYSITEEYTDNATSLTPLRLTFQKQFAALLIEALEVYKIDEESLGMVAFYLHITLFLTYCNRISDKQKEALLSFDPGNYMDTYGQDDFARQVNMYEDLLQDITIDFKTGHSRKFQYSLWLPEWVALCETIIDTELKEKLADAPGHYDELLHHSNQLTNVISEHLGLTPNRSAIIMEATRRLMQYAYWGKKFSLSFDETAHIAAHRQGVQATQQVLERLDDRPIPDTTREIRLFVIARNESLRMTYFLKHYTALGVNRFFIVDNNSTDNTTELALQHDNVHVFRTKESFRDHWNWMQYMLETYGKNSWCVVVDVDELLTYPYSEKIDLPILISYLEANNYTAMQAILLDMYPTSELQDAIYYTKDNPLSVCTHFDSEIKRSDYISFDYKTWKMFRTSGFIGGMRQRVFGNAGDQRFCLTKNPLMKYQEDTYLSPGMHAINNVNIADIEGVVFHTKFLSDFRGRVAEEAVREVHYEGAVEYKIYESYASEHGKLNFFYEKSVAYQDTQQLVDLGFMIATPDYLDYVKEKAS